MTTEPAQFDAAAKPDVFRMDLAEIGEQPFPRPESEYRIVLEKGAYETIVSHGETNPEVERCGVLVGDLFKDADGPFLVITHAIRGERAKEDVSRVRFTHSTWEHIHKVMDEQHPGKRIVGWYHMHPGFGVFLSEVDLFAHRNFFNAAWQVALVVDSKTNREGFFFWRDGEIVRAKRYWVEEEERWALSERGATQAVPGLTKKRPLETPAEDEAKVERDDASGAGPLLVNPVVLIMFALLCLALVYLNLRANVANAELRARLAGLERELARQGPELASSLALWARERLDRGERVEKLRPIYEEILRLDRVHEPTYRKLLPELAPLSRPGGQRRSPPEKE